MRKLLYISSIASMVLGLLVQGASAGEVTFHGSGTNPASGQNLGATAHFETSGSDLVVTLSNVGDDVLVPTDVLTAVFFELGGDPHLASTSAVLAAGSTVRFGTSDPSGVVGGEWGYGFGIAGGPGGAPQGISSSGFGLFGQATFPGNNLQGPTALDGLQYGVVSAVDDSSSGNSQVTGSQALIHSSVVFTLGGLPPGFDPAAQVTNVWFQYGTQLSDPVLPGSPDLGACCLVTGCQILSESDCAAAGGQWNANIHSCDPDPCRGTPTDQRSWGTLKNIYRTPAK